MTFSLEETLKHYGVPGMKWGVRRNRTPNSVTVSTKPGKRVKTSGGKNQPASSDAKVAASLRQKAKSSTTDSLSNDELQTLVKRMNLEQQYSSLSSQKRGAGSKFIKEVILGTSKNEIKRAAGFKANQVGDAFKNK